VMDKTNPIGLWAAGGYFQANDGAVVWLLASSGTWRLLGDTKLRGINEYFSTPISLRMNGYNLELAPTGADTCPLIMSPYSVPTFYTEGGTLTFTINTNTVSQLVNSGNPSAIFDNSSGLVVINISGSSVVPALPANTNFNWGNVDVTSDFLMLNGLQIDPYGGVSQIHIKTLTLRTQAHVSFRVPGTAIIQVDTLVTVGAGPFYIDSISSGTKAEVKYTNAPRVRNVTVIDNVALTSGAYPATTVNGKVMNSDNWNDAEEGNFLAFMGQTS